MARNFLTLGGGFLIGFGATSILGGAPFLGLVCLATGVTMIVFHFRLKYRA